MKKYYALLFVLCNIALSCRKQSAELTGNNVAETIDPTWLRYPVDMSATVSSFSNQAATFPMTSYISLPATNIYLPSPSQTVSYSGQIYYGGPFQLCASVISGNTITFMVKRTDGLPFPAKSIISIKYLTVGGLIAKSVTLTSPATTYSFAVNEIVKWNINGGKESNHNNTDKFVATWYNPASKYTFYTQPVEIVAVPTGYGANIGNLQNVPVYSNGFGGFWGTNDMLDGSCNNAQKYQCVHFIQRYYLQIKTRNILNAYAGDYWNNFTLHKLTQKILNGKGTPQQGDIICFYNTVTGDYHVGIVNAVIPPPYVANIVRVFHENVGQSDQGNGNYCTPFSDFTFTKTTTGCDINGASKLGSNWVTLGWVR